MGYLENLFFSLLQSFKVLLILFSSRVSVSCLLYRLMVALDFYRTT